MGVYYSTKTSGDDVTPVHGRLVVVFVPGVSSGERLPTDHDLGGLGGFKIRPGVGPPVDGQARL